MYNTLMSGLSEASAQVVGMPAALQDHWPEAAEQGIAHQRRHLSRCAVSKRLQKLAIYDGPFFKRNLRRCLIELDLLQRRFRDRSARSEAPGV